MTPVLILGAGCVGFALGWFARRRRLSLLAENNHWVGEEIEALKGADLAADVAEHRRRHSGEHPPVDDPEEMPRHLWPAQFVGLVTPGPGPVPMTGERDTEAQDRELTEVYGLDEPERTVATTHRCPPGSESLTPCCGRTPFELPMGDRITVDDALVTCRTVEDPTAVEWVHTPCGTPITVLDDGSEWCPTCGTFLDPEPLPDLDASDVRSLPTRRVSD